jgi:hypothetical protein
VKLSCGLRLFTEGSSAVFLLEATIDVHIVPSLDFRGHCRTLRAHTHRSLVSSQSAGAGAFVRERQARRETTKKPVPAARARKARLRPDLLNSSTLAVNLFDDVEHVVSRTKVDRPAADRFVWHGRTEDGGDATFAVVNGVLTGTVLADGRSFEVTSDPDGDYTITELDPAAFPTEAPLLPPPIRPPMKPGSLG